MLGAPLPDIHSSEWEIVRDKSARHGVVDAVGDMFVESNCAGRR